MVKDPVAIAVGADAFRAGECTLQSGMVDRGPLVGPARSVAESMGKNTVDQTASDMLDRRSRVAGRYINDTLDSGSDLLVIRAAVGLLGLITLVGRRGRCRVNAISCDPQGAPIGRRNCCG